MISEKQTAKNTLERITSPENLPEAGFQSYEQFANNGALSQEEPFLRGELRNPHSVTLNFKA